MNEMLTCFICNQSVGYSRAEDLESNSSIPSGKAISFQLGKILGISIGNLNKIHAQNQFDRIVYCPTCLERILYVQDILQELERLQKTLEHEKFLIESQLNASAENVKHSETHDEICTQIRTDILKVMQQTIPASGFDNRQNSNYKDPNDEVFSGVMADLISQEFRDSDMSRSEFQNFNLNMKSETVDDNNEPSSSDSDPLALQYSDNQNSSASVVVPRNNANMTNENNKKCVVCKKTFTSRKGLQFHVQTVHNKMHRFRCYLCSYSCQSSTVMKLHMKYHTNVDNNGSNGFQCNRCPKFFYSQRLLTLHLRFVHGVLSKKRHTKGIPKKCNDCGKILSSTSTWKNHVLSVHKREFKFKCQLCDYGSQTPYNLNRHMITHKNN